MAFLSVATSIFAAFGVYALYTLLKLLHQEFASSLRNLPGPKSKNWLLGHRPEILENLDGQEGLWTSQYGRTLRINAVFGFSGLYTTDCKAVQHILSNSYLYQKPAPRRYVLGRVVGPGVLIVEEDHHKKQRKILNPAFGPAQLRVLTEIFVEKSRQLRDVWASKAAEAGGVTRVNVIPEFNTAALDIIGKAGFNYDFRSIGSDWESIRDELHEAFATISAAGERQAGLISILKAQFPLMRRLLPNTKIDKVIEGCQATMRGIGQRLLRDSRQKIVDGSSVDSAAARDLLSLLVRANMSKDISEAQRLSEEDVLARNTAATWAVFELARNPEIQTRLRNELLVLDTENPSMDDLNSLKYLDAVVRETLRAHAPVPLASRVAMRDDVIPLETPYTDATGTVHETIRLTKGQSVVLPILAINRDPAIWGADADQFIPERWERSPAISTGIPGHWSQMLTFLGGPRACIGFRFSLIEMKALLFTLVRGFEFELPVPATDVGRHFTTIVQQPVLRSDPSAGSQMPILVKPFGQA
ncbi:cytochrome P450 [Mycena albidolilacea]|uniref:Cytochrome P450 n=1 Tax=Mycena albidolilacea TaxID=1033008 RepID=A0AAD6YY01_9AGAR|nr:cytochrome P450 [Mycena albidolilacea]